ncbi:hypothetical protein [Runella salmonicolor]|uniref:Uncharacterized protein n=1 Tax=Runella salmonicolor TaxID=2950278 RepID=A0ABT1FIC6_9BACT|nr:hypothetical protein [Runella salmonicolor]MCP1381518.1 hypothetical protein [Runella salmonicolor]
MKKHSGMRPQDIVIILKIIAGSKWPGAWKNRVEESQPSLVSSLRLFPPTNKTIASSLRISESEVSESLRRSAYAGLIRDATKRLINKKAVFDFMRYGLKYAFPARPGALVRGVPTAQSAPPLNTIILSEEHYVWEYEEGTVRGQLIEPLYPTLPSIVENDANLYELLALADAIRTGSARIESIASEELEKRILSSWGDM